MLACRWNKLLTCFITYILGKTAVNDAFFQNLSLNFRSFLDLYLNEIGSSVDNNR